MKTETDNLSEEELSLKKLQKLLLSEDRNQFTNELETLQRKIKKQIQTSELAQSEVVSKLEYKQYNQLVATESKINSLLNKLNFETSERINQLAQTTDESNKALASIITGRIDGLNSEFIEKLDETASANSNKLHQESHSLKSLISELRQSVNQSINSQNNTFTSLLSKTDKNLEAFQKEMLQFIEDNNQTQSTLEATSNDLINSLRNLLNTQITDLQNSLNIQRKELQQNMNELVSSATTQQEKSTKEAVANLNTSFSSSLENSVSVATARETELQKLAFNKIEACESGLAARISDEISSIDYKITQTSDLLEKQILQIEVQANNFTTEKTNEYRDTLIAHIQSRLHHLDSNLKADTDNKVAQSIELLKEQISQTEAQANSFTTEKVKECSDTLTTHIQSKLHHLDSNLKAGTDKKVTQLNEKLKEQILTLEAKLNTQTQTISSLEFHQDKISEVFNKTLEKKIKNNPSEVAALLSPIISQIISKAKSDDLNSIAAATSQYIPAHLKQLQENSPESQKTLDEILSKGLVRAIQLQGTQPDSPFSKSLAPTIGSGLQNQIKVDKDKIVDALYPVIGSTISKYMAESMKDLMIKINKKIDETLSFKKYFKRIKSKITGKEMQLDDSLNATVQSIYMIHKSTGVVILDRHLENLENKNSQMVGGMFTAITSFVNDWIQKEGENKAIDSIEYGDSKVIFEASGSLILAMVVSVGEVRQIKNLARDFLTKTHIENSEQISNYNGNPNSLPDSFKSSLDSFFS